MDEIEFLRELVSIPSLSGQEADAAAFLVSAMNSLGLDASIDQAGNTVGSRACLDADGRVTQEIMLLGHIDTVPGAIPVRIKGGRLFGRGTVDAKGPLAAFVIAAARSKLPLGTRVVVAGAVEEESATSKGARYLATQYQPDICIIGEPSGWDGVTLGYKGRILLDYTLAQPMGHTAGREKGVAETAVAWWNDLQDIVTEFNQGRERLFDQLLPSLRQIHTDSDGLTNSITIKAGIRLPPDFDIENFSARINQLAGEASLRCYAYEPATQSNRRTPLARAFNRALRQAGVRPRFKLKTGTSDMNVVAPLWNCPIVAYGPGDSSLDHTPDEHINLDAYVRAIEVLQDVLEAGINV
ncbi:MAG: [LysW]-lysine hydrolase, partial [Anaerolineaceae bacterium]